MADQDKPAKRAADGLGDVVLKLEEVDLNALIDDDVLRIVEMKQELHEICARYRHDQHAAERGGGAVGGER